VTDCFTVDLKKKVQRLFFKITIKSIIQDWCEADSCNHSYLGGGRQEGQSSRPVKGEAVRPHLNKYVRSQPFRRQK
jgi:iron only hydrogenase large subunit-like protein